MLVDDEKLSMVCPTWNTWGRCWRKEGDLSLESSPKGLVLSWEFTQTLAFRCVRNVRKILCEFHRYPPLPVTHCVKQGDMGYL